MNFTVDEPILRDLAWNGKGKITYKVMGLESYRGPAEFTLDVKRNSRYDDQTHWSFRVDDLSYSVDLKDPAGYKNYAEALRSAADKIEQLVGMEHQLELIFQEGERQRQAEIDAEKARIAAQREADAPVGMKVAKRIVKEMQRISREELGRWSDSGAIHLYERGTHKKQDIKVSRSGRGLILFSLNYSRIKRTDVEKLIADSCMDKLDVSEIGMPDPRVMGFLLTKSRK